MLLHLKRLSLFLIVLIIISIITTTYYDYSIIANFIIPSQWDDQIKIDSKYGSDIHAELFADGLSFPTSMVFVDNNTILILEKNSGNIRMISDGVLQQDPLYKVQNISNEKEQGLLGIAVLKNNNQTTDRSYPNGHYLNKNNNNPHTDITHSINETVLRNSDYLVYLYFTEKLYNTNNNTDSEIHDLNYTARNRMYEYTWNGIDSLSNPRLLLDVPAGNGPYHNGGKIKIDNNKNLFVVIGDLTTINNTLQNYPGGENPFISVPNNSSVIIRINPSIHSYIPNDNPFYKYYNEDNNLHSLSYYYAYGIRNSFGMDIDPVTGKMWNTENGEDSYDEINLVSAGFNSGWYKLMGPLERNNNSSISDLIMLKGSHYLDPKFSWKMPIGITDIEFLESSRLGDDLKNNILVGDINNGNLYLFKLNSDRSEIDIKRSLNSPENDKGLEDLVADNQDESDKIIFGKGFDGRITDIETGPDGNLYVLTYFDGHVYRLS